LTEPGWRGCDPREVAWRSWGDETVVYADATASTHLLTARAGQVFQLLVGVVTPLTPAAVAARAATSGLAIDADELLDTLEGLAAVGLVQASVS